MKHLLLYGWVGIAALFGVAVLTVLMAALMMKLTYALRPWVIG